MKKVLLGLMALSAVSFANDGFTSIEEMDKTGSFEMHTEHNGAKGAEGKSGKNDNELNITKYLGDKTKMELEVGYNYDQHDQGNQSTDVQLEFTSQISDSGRYDLYIDIDGDAQENGNYKGHIDVMPTYNIMRNDKGFSLVRAGLGYGGHGHKSGNKNKEFNDGGVRYVAEFKNVYSVNQYLELEGNVYYTKESENDKSTTTLEAYAYLNYPLYKNDRVKVEALLEGGLDPYNFGERQTDDKSDTERYDDLYLYIQPTVKATVDMGDFDVFGEYGYYMQQEGGSGIDNDSDNGDFIKIGFETKL